MCKIGTWTALNIFFIAVALHPLTSLKGSCDLIESTSRSSHLTLQIPQSDGEAREEQKINQRFYRNIHYLDQVKAMGLRVCTDITGLANLLLPVATFIASFTASSETVEFLAGANAIVATLYNRFSTEQAKTLAIVKKSAAETESRLQNKITALDNHKRKFEQLNGDMSELKSQKNEIATKLEIASEQLNKTKQKKREQKEKQTYESVFQSSTPVNIQLSNDYADSLSRLPRKSFSENAASIKGIFEDAKIEKFIKEHNLNSDEFIEIVNLLMINPSMNGIPHPI